MFAQHVYDTLQVSIYFALVAYGFYFSSVSCRHFNFTIGLGVLAGPYTLLVVRQHIGNFAGVIVALLACICLGILYNLLSSWLIGRGARQGQLLIVSLAIMAIGENVIKMIFGSTSLSLWEESSSDVLLSQSWITVTRPQVIFVLSGLSLVIAFLMVWRKTMFGIAIRGLLDSRLNMVLHGHDVQLLESVACGTGFMLAGAAGILWSVDTRIQPAMSLEVGVLGVVSLIVGPMIKSGLAGLVWTSLAIAILQVLMVVVLEGDWTMTSSLLLLGIALLFRGGNVTARMGATEL